MDTREKIKKELSSFFWDVKKLQKHYGNNEVPDFSLFAYSDAILTLTEADKAQAVKEARDEIFDFLDGIDMDSEIPDRVWVAFYIPYLKSINQYPLTILRNSKKKYEGDAK